MGGCGKRLCRQRLTRFVGERREILAHLPVTRPAAALGEVTLPPTPDGCP